MKKKQSTLIQVIFILTFLFYFSIPSFASQGTALKLDGYNDYVDIPWAESLNTNQFSICCWVKINQSRMDYDQIIISSYLKDEKKGFLLLSTYYHKWQFCIGDGDKWNVLTSDKDVLLNQWTHISATFNSRIMRIYVNGIFSG